jgi:hypothetical protein
MMGSDLKRASYMTCRLEREQGINKKEFIKIEGEE